MDAISWLPDEVLGKILSLLPTEEAASTSLLSKKWKNVYRLVENLDFDDSALGLDKLECDVFRIPTDGGGYMSVSVANRYVFPESFKKFVDTTLALQADYPINKFSLKCYTGFNESPKACVNRWISNVVERGVLELDLRIKGRGEHLMSPQLFKSKTLVKLTLGTEILLGKLPSDLSLPCLKNLFIDTVSFFEKQDFSGVLLAGCPVLEELSSVHQKGFEGTPTNISSPTLKRLSVSYNYQFTSRRSLYLSLNLPNLVYLDYSDFALTNYPQVNLESLVEAKLDLGLSKDQVLPDLTQVFLGIRNVEILHLSPVSAQVIYGNCRDKLPMLNNLVKLSFGTKRARLETVTISA